MKKISDLNNSFGTSNLVDTIPLQYIYLFSCLITVRKPIFNHRKYLARIVGATEK